MLIIHFSGVKVTELFEDEEKVATNEEEVIEVESDAESEAWNKASKTDPLSDARRRLEDVLAERRLKTVLDDYFELNDT